MLKILIADDEKKVGMLVKELIRWEELPLSLIGIAQDGKAACEAILRERPDIVITDIRMPGLSGLDMIKRVVEQGLCVRFIVISGYRYFEYAQTALKYGVEDYLLKPIEEEELNAILHKVCGEAEEKKQEERRVEHLRERLDNSRHVLHRELISSISRGGGAPIEEVNKDYGVNLDDGIFRAAAVKVDRNIRQERNERQEELIMKKLREIAEAEFRGKVIDMVVSAQENMGLLLLLNYTQEGRAAVRESLHGMFGRMEDYMNDFANYEVTLGVSREGTDFAHINLLLEMAREAVNCRIYEGCGRWIESYSQDRNQEARPEDILREYREELDKAAAIMDGRQAEEYVRHCLRAAQDRQVMACEFYELARGMARQFFEEIARLFEENMEEEEAWLAERIRHCKSVAMMEHCMCSAFHDILLRLGQKRREAEGRPVREAVEYMKKNYGRKILLDDVAAMYGFNPNYFSEIFKNGTGKNFSAYLLELRMEAAKELLRDTKETVYEIAAKVGYKDAKFFSQQFVKVVGIKPNEYRKLYF